MNWEGLVSQQVKHSKSKRAKPSLSRRKRSRVASQPTRLITGLLIYFVGMKIFGVGGLGELTTERLGLGGGARICFLVGEINPSVLFSNS
jgi:hypothetical protein